MADPLNISASIGSLLQISSIVIRYLYKVKDATAEKDRLLDEIIHLRGILAPFDDVANPSQEGTDEPLLAALESLPGLKGPLRQLQLALELLKTRLAPAEGPKKLGKAFSWPFRKEEVAEILGMIERLKTIFILTLQGKEREASCAIQANVAAVSSQLSQLQIAQTETQKGRHREKVLRWLSRVDVSTSHNAACNKREPTTGKWFLQSQEFVDWKSSPNRTLWLHGIPGCGKTVLSSTVIEEVKRHCRVTAKSTLAYFYFDFKDHEKQSVTSLLCSVIAQLAWEESTLPEAVQDLYSRYGEKGQQPNQSDLVKALSLSLKDGGNNYIIMDALDECNEQRERESLLNVISQLAEANKAKLHLLVTSRWEHDIVHVLKPLATYSIPLTGEGVDTDINLYIRNALSADPKLKRRPGSIKEEIEKALVGGAHGMFRWVFCQLDTLRNCLSIPAVRQCLKQLPKDLDETYDRILCSIPEQEMDHARAVLQWLAFSERPLYLEEVSEAAIMNFNGCVLDFANRLFDPECVLDVCSSLVTYIIVEDYDPGSESGVQRKQLGFAHFSVKEYIVSERIRNAPSSKFAALELEAQANLGNFCISYLLHFDKPSSLFDEDLKQFHLLRYSAQNWFKHVAKVKDDASDGTATSPLVNQLFHVSGCPSFSNWLRIFVPDNPYRPKRMKKNEKVNELPLYYAAFLGLYETSASLLDKGADVNAQGGEYGNALQAAVKNHNEAIVRLLLDRGADVNAQGGYYGNALQAAAGNGNEAIVRLLLDNRANINAQGGKYGNALQAAVKKDNEAIVKLLLDSGAERNIPSN